MAHEKDRSETVKDVLGENRSWDAVYHDLAPEELPWNAGGPDSVLVRLVESAKIPVGRAIDIGAGPGHDAIYLAKKGFQVLAIDISPRAIELAKTNAKTAGMERAIDFRVEDVLKLSSPGSSAAFVNDRGCFHVLAPPDRNAYIFRIHRVLAANGCLLLRTFSDKEPPGPGPYRFTRKKLEDLFTPQFDLLEFEEGVFEGPRKPEAYLCLFRKNRKRNDPPGL